MAENWEDDDEEPASAPSGHHEPKAVAASRTSSGSAHTPEKPNWAQAPVDDDALASELEKLEVK